jgi:hypothetical protein
MRVFKLILATSAIAIAMTAVPKSSAQVVINFGAEPSCPYGYYDYGSYDCAPYGYYGPEWFVGGRFIGTGHWYHGPANFHGNVNNNYDPRHGYKGAPVQHGPAQQHPDNFKSFKGNESHDSQGHASPSEHGGHK